MTTDLALATCNANIRKLNRQIAWVNIQLFWYLGYGPVLLAAVFAGAAAAAF